MLPSDTAKDDAFKVTFLKPPESILIVKWLGKLRSRRRRRRGCRLVKDDERTSI